MSKEFLKKLTLNERERQLVANECIGYSENEIALIEKLYDISIQGDFKEFLMCMGRSSGGILGDNWLVFAQRMSVRNHVIVQDLSREIFFDVTDDFSYIREKAFFLSVDPRACIKTTSDQPEKVYQLDERENKVFDTGNTFIEYIQRAIFFSRKNTYTNIVCRGELLTIDRPDGYFIEEI